MSKVRVAGFGVSLDGFSAGTEQSLNDPLGKRGPEIFQWFFHTKTFRAMQDDMDFDAGRVISGDITLPQAGRELAEGIREDQRHGDADHDRPGDRPRAQPAIRISPVRGLHSRYLVLARSGEHTYR